MGANVKVGIYVSRSRSMIDNKVGQRPIEPLSPMITSLEKLAIRVIVCINDSYQQASRIMALIRHLKGHT